MEELKTWLQGFSLWDGEEPEIDTTRPVPGSVGIFPQDMEQISLRQDLLGGKVCTYRQKFLLRRVAVAGEAAAGWLESLGRWVADQSHRGLCPQLGRGNTRWELRKGRLAKTDMTGLATYEAELTATYEMVFDGGDV